MRQTGAPTYVFDPLRRKNVPLTPEEEVRQGFIRWLEAEVGVPLSLMASEYPFTFNGLQYRADIVVFDRGLSPVALVECKAPEVSLGRDVLEQVIRYNRVLGVKYIFITNGQLTYLCKWNAEEGRYGFSADIPSYRQMIAPDEERT